MKELLIIAHGSRRASSNEEVVQLVSKVAQEENPGVDNVALAFLEFAEPTIEVALEGCLQRGAEEVVVLPYFLSAGNHVVKDIPHEVSKVQDKWPDKTITILPHLGASGAMPALLAQSS